MANVEFIEKVSLRREQTEWVLQASGTKIVCTPRRGKDVSI